MPADQGTLAFEPPAPRTALEAEFERWLHSDDGRVVVALAADKAFTLQRAGWKAYGIASIVESIRWDRAVQVGPDAEGYKINNNHRAYLARYLMSRHPRLADFFHTRDTSKQPDTSQQP